MNKKIRAKAITAIKEYIKYQFSDSNVKIISFSSCYIGLDFTQFGLTEEEDDEVQEQKFLDELVSEALSKCPKLTCFYCYDGWQKEWYIIRKSTTIGKENFFSVSFQFQD